MDDTPREEMQRQRTAREDSKYRAATEAENQARFAAMLKGGEEGARWCLRARMNMQDDNGTCRDPVLYRVNETPHHRTGTKYKAYPTYDFACPIVDSLEGVTHALRSSEYHDRDIQFYRLQVRARVSACVGACVCGCGWVCGRVGLGRSTKRCVWACVGVLRKGGRGQAPTPLPLHALPPALPLPPASPPSPLQDMLGVRRVVIQDFARLNFVYTLLSKRKLTWFVDKGHVEGWHDPRFPTVQGILRRGVVVPALREFILAQGASRRPIEMEWDKFWATNKKHIDPIAPRYTALAAGATVPFTLANVPAEAEHRTVPLHPKNADVGIKSIVLSQRLLLDAADAAAMKEGEEITLMKWGNAIVRTVRGRSGAGVRAVPRGGCSGVSQPPLKGTGAPWGSVAGVEVLAY